MRHIFSSKAANTIGAWPYWFLPCISVKALGFRGWISKSKPLGYGQYRTDMTGVGYSEQSFQSNYIIGSEGRVISTANHNYYIRTWYNSGGWLYRGEAHCMDKFCWFNIDGPRHGVVKAGWREALGRRTSQIGPELGTETEMAWFKAAGLIIDFKDNLTLKFA